MLSMILKWSRNQKYFKYKILQCWMYVFVCIHKALHWIILPLFFMRKFLVSKMKQSHMHESKLKKNKNKNTNFSPTPPGQEWKRSFPLINRWIAHKVCSMKKNSPSQAKQSFLKNSSWDYYSMHNCKYFFKGYSEKLLYYF